MKNICKYILCFLLLFFPLIIFAYDSCYEEEESFYNRKMVTIDPTIGLMNFSDVKSEHFTSAYDNEKNKYSIYFKTPMLGKHIEGREYTLMLTSQGYTCESEIIRDDFLSEYTSECIFNIDKKTASTMREFAAKARIIDEKFHKHIQWIDSSEYDSAKYYDIEKQEWCVSFWLHKPVLDKSFDDNLVLDWSTIEISTFLENSKMANQWSILSKTWELSFYVKFKDVSFNPAEGYYLDFRETPPISGTDGWINWFNGKKYFEYNPETEEYMAKLSTNLNYSDYNQKYIDDSYAGEKYTLDDLRLLIYRWDIQRYWSKVSFDRIFSITGQMDVNLDDTSVMKNKRYVFYEEGIEEYFSNIEDTPVEDTSDMKINWKLLQGDVYYNEDDRQIYVKSYIENVNSKPIPEYYIEVSKSGWSVPVKGIFQYDSENKQLYAVTQLRYYKDHESRKLNLHYKVKLDSNFIDNDQLKMRIDFDKTSFDDVGNVNQSPSIEESSTNKESVEQISTPSKLEIAVDKFILKQRKKYSNTDDLKNHLSLIITLLEEYIQKKPEYKDIIEQLNIIIQSRIDDM